MKVIVLAALLLLPTLGLAQQVYKCPGAGGQVEFQQTPCASGKGEAMVVRATNVVEANPAGQANVTREAVRNAGVRSAAARGQLLSGMNTAELQQLMGSARVVNSDYFNGTVRQQHVYRWPDGSARYVYTQDGVVTGLQERPAPLVLPAARPCNDGARLSDLHFRKGSVTRTPEEKHAIQRQIDAIESNRCR